MSQRDLAENAGASQNHIIYLIEAEKVNVTRKTMESVSRAVGGKGEMIIEYPAE